jgi:hypothetical protein
MKYAAIGAGIVLAPAIIFFALLTGALLLGEAGVRANPPAPLPPGTVSGKGYGQYLYGRRIA